ncbi:MAG: hypothetical protein K2Q33_04095 [Gammaproteobacteria bacterium]|nr:hypothetical protein [Gammaproteobacteria bacterium]
MISSGIWMVLTVIAKWLPHTANYSPEIAMTVYLASRYRFLTASLLTLITVEIADIGLALFYHYSVLGWWSLFNAISLLLIIGFFARPWLKWRFLDVIGRVFCAALFYWLVTNLGVWLSSGYYPLVLSGLIACYDMALPFLPAQLLSAVAFAALWVVLEWVIKAKGMQNRMKLRYKTLS